MGCGCQSGRLSSAITILAGADALEHLPRESKPHVVGTRSSNPSGRRLYGTQAPRGADR